ncbi:endonuclease domain-containing protein [Agrococcus sp. SGAir0287]|uniref:endonuclease domain-containing protein n=1 Tax=Agrococcus sp. SGAir0287 TaxID=2070347 RepID=UPI0010CD29A9|nr:DUF559 domain-containing protein [Agrococcus sp. SGAir0287]QCR19661.1 hypothetical protein C1N71_09705 [Agrococcus sp. SGAir0287]
MHEPFSVRSGYDRGLTRGSMRGPAFSTPVRGTRIAASLAIDHGVLVTALLELARTDQFLSHVTAAAIHGIPLPARLRGGRIHVSSPSGVNRMRRPEVVGHRVKAEVVEVDGVPVECPLDTVIHLATMLSVPELVVAIDWLLHPANRMSVSKAALVERLEHFRGARGLGRLRAAIALARVGAESPRESELRLLLVRHGLPEPHLNLDVRDDAGVFVARVDMAWPDLRIAVEYDGEQHRVDARQFARDIDRLADLERVGWIVVRVTKEHLRRPMSDVLPRVREAFARRGVVIPAV